MLLAAVCGARVSHSFQSPSSPLVASPPSPPSRRCLLLPSPTTTTRRRRQSSVYAVEEEITTKDCRDSPTSIGGDVNGENGNKNDGPVLLQPFLPALDPNYPVRGPVGNGKFLLSRSGPPTHDELTNDQILLIVRDDIATDLEVNTLVWKCLGYRFDNTNEKWTDGEVFPKWKERYPITPPDLIGMQRTYSREVDLPSLRSNQELVKSIPLEHKQSLKTHLSPLGWKGYQYKELTPNKTRRAQCANWLIFYREELFGYTIEELAARRRKKREMEENMSMAKVGLDVEMGKRQEVDEWKPPLNEVY